MIGIGLTYVFVTCCFYSFVQFFNKLIRGRKTTRETSPFLGLMVLYLLVGIAYLVATFYDYYVWDQRITVFDLHKWYVMLLAGGGAGFSFLCENVFKKSRFMLTTYVIIVTIILYFTSDTETLDAYLIYFYLPALGAGIIISYFVFMKPTSGFLRRRMLLTIPGLFFFVGGNAMRLSTIAVLLGIYGYAGGTLFIIVGFNTFGYAFTAFSTFTDINWKKKMREILVISNTGLCLYAFSFEKDLPLNDTDLVAGGFSGIRTLLAEMVKTTESLQLIDYKNVKIMLEQGTEVVFILIIKEESAMLRYRLKQFAQEFQDFFKEILPSWSGGSTSVFAPTKVLIQKIFEITPPLTDLGS